jgi:SpoVK/Ycf46/Vps4 family AAA+-type ATPase
MAREAADVRDLEALLRNARSEPMQGLADRIPARFDFDDLELPPRQKARLKSFAHRRAEDVTVLEDWGLGPALGAEKGAIALFTGPSGVGKTMAAGIVAHVAGLDLWRINIATLVSKYIGETEANLDRIFRAADRAEVMLFFDEAEALFSKRAEVKEARDRYANMEMAYLLQRIEDFRGMAILASNMSTSLEPAMQRRFDLVMDFQMPDAAARRRLWGRIETGQAPLANDVDMDALAEGFDLAGGHIRQAILSAAHEAVATGEITQAHLMKAIAQEYVKLGRPIRKEQFGSHFAKVRGVG